MPSKNKFSIDNREQKKSVVQRFMTDDIGREKNDPAIPEKFREETMEPPSENKNKTSAVQSPEQESSNNINNTASDPAEIKQNTLKAGEYMNNTSAPDVNSESIKAMQDQMLRMQKMLEEQQQLISIQLKPVQQTVPETPPQQPQPATSLAQTVNTSAPQPKPQETDDEINPDEILKKIKMNENLSVPAPKHVNTYTPPKYYFKNTMEEAVVMEVESTLKNTKNMCRCERCFSDICAIVLNSLKPHYVTSATGELFDKASFLNIVNLSKISVEVFKAIDMVKKKPSH